MKPLPKAPLAKVGELRSPPEIMGVINLTPDSFSDGGRFTQAQEVYHAVEPWLAAGLSWLDLGGESSRPGAQPLSAEQEWRRIAPTLEDLSKRHLADARISIDSRHPVNQLRALDYPVVGMINSVTGMPQNDHLELLYQRKPNLIYLAMHMHRTPRVMQERPLSEEESLAAVQNFFDNALQSCSHLGIPRDQILLDPGIGFGKSYRANLALLEQARLWARDYPLAYGISRKSFLGHYAGIDQPNQRDGVSKVSEIMLLRAGVKCLRTHAPLPLLSYLKGDL